MTLKSYASFEEKLTGGLKNDMINLANFHRSTWKCQNWDFDPFVQNKKGMTLKFTEELCVMAKKNNAKFKKELTCRRIISNLTNGETFSSLISTKW